MKIGVIGCGAISGQYLENLVRRFDFCVEVSACADQLPEAARRRAEEYQLGRHCSPREMYDDPDIELIVNLTNPAAHYSVSKAALLAGKSVYCEKPITVEREQIQELLTIAQDRGVRIGGAPDTFLGAGLQTCRKLIDTGWIGVPITCTSLISFGAAFQRYYDVFRGPVFDMGPYYLTALVSMLGPVRRAAGSARTPFPERKHSDPASDQYGENYAVSTPGCVAGALEFHSGVVGTFTATCETFGYFPRLEVFGTEGTLICPDPNNFGGPVLFQPRSGERREAPLLFPYNDQNRGLGVAEMAAAIRAGRPHRASGELCSHVLDIGHALHESSTSDRWISVDSSVERPSPLPSGFDRDAFLA